MKKIRELIHKIGNCHNKISVGAGLIKEELKGKVKDNSIFEEVIDGLTDMERQAIEASRALNQLKDLVYETIDPDTEKPKRGGLNEREKV